MSDPSNIAKLDLNTLSEFQKALHAPKKADEDLESRFYYEFRKTSWSTHMPVKMKCTASDDGLVYQGTFKFDFLLYSYMRQKLPPLKVKENFKKTIQICWPHNPGLNILKDASLKSDDDIIQAFDNIWLNMHSQFYRKSGGGKDAHHNLMIGNVPFLQGWTHYLPEYMLDVPQPWYYSRNEVVAMPLFLCSLSSITHNYKVRSKLSEMLRMRARANEESEWKDIKFNPKYLEGVGPEDTLPIPELWGRYALITDDEREWRKTQKNKVYIEDIVIHSSDDPTRYGSTVPIGLQTEMPTKAIFWVAENLEATKYNNYSNFTTNSTDLYDGWNPIMSTKLTYGSTPRVELDSDSFDRIEPWYHFPSAPYQSGYNAYSISYDSSSINADIGMVFKDLGAKLVPKLGNTDPFLKKLPYKRTDTANTDMSTVDSIPEELESPEDEGETMDKTRFSIHVRLLVMKKIKFKDGKCRIPSIKPIISTPSYDIPPTKHDLSL